MPVSALLITLKPPADQAAAELARDLRLTLGEAHGMRLPAVLETETLEEATSAFEELCARPSVRFVDVLTVDFSDLEGGA